MLRAGLFSNFTVAEFEEFADKYDDVELVETHLSASKEDAYKLKDFDLDALVFNTRTREDEDYYKILSDAGIKYLCCCSAGFDHMNLARMKKYGMMGANVPQYSPNAIAEHTVMLVLSLLRHLREQVLRIENHNYAIGGLLGRELRNMTVGIIGAGRIGTTTLQCLSGFNPKKIYAYDLYENPSLKDKVEYVALDELYAKCDIIILHCALTDNNVHFIDKNAIDKMKEGALIVNSRRGPLIDNEALLYGIESGKLAGCALDVIDGEELLDKSKGSDTHPVRRLEKLMQSPNVIFTHHSAFFTDEAFRNMHETCIDNLHEYARTGKCSKELVK